MEYLVRHRTAYHYLQDVSYSCHLAHLLPRRTAHQQVHASELTLSPAPAEQHRRVDYFGNAVEWFAIDQPHKLLEIVCESRLAVMPWALEDEDDDLAWELVRRVLEDNSSPQAQDAIQYLFDSPLTGFQSDIAAYAGKSFAAGRPILSATTDLMTRIHKDFRYDTTVTDATTPVDRVFEVRAGVCQDLAHVAIACLRSIGLAARYVSGYLLTEPPPGQPRLLGADASHAWFSVWVPPFGWVDFDPTNKVRAGEGHVTVAWGRDYADVAPVNGAVTGGGDHVIEVGVDVLPVQPKGDGPTKPAAGKV